MKNWMWFLLFVAGSVHAQQFQFDDPNTIFKDTLGNTLNRDSIFSMFSRFSITVRQKDLENGKREITLIPAIKSQDVTSYREDSLWVQKWMGKPLPDFNLVDMNNQSFTNTMLGNKIVVINFWFIGCKPCVMEMPELNLLRRKYIDNDIIFLAPSLDKKPALNNFFKNHQFDYTVLVDAKAFAKKLDVNMYPTHIIVDNTGKIIELFTGASKNVQGRLDSKISEVMK